MTCRPRKILLVSHDFSLTGAPIVLMHLAEQLKEKFAIQVVAAEVGPLRMDLINRGVNARIVPGFFDNPSIVAACLEQTDLLIANTLLTFLPVHVAARLKKPSVWYIHEGYAGLKFIQLFSPWMGSAIPLATRFVAPCEFVSKLYSAYRQGSIDIIPYGVSAFPEQTTSKSAQKIKLLQIGSIEPRKGQDLSFQVLDLIPTDAPITLDIVGGIQDQTFSEQLKRHTAGHDRIRWHGSISIELAQAMIGSCDILLVPSRDEVTPMVILEAMSAGKPVIASSVGGVPEMIRSNVTGFLFDPGDCKSMMMLIDRLIPDSQLRKTVGRNAQDFVHSNRTLRQFGINSQSYSNHYDFGVDLHFNTSTHWPYEQQETLCPEQFDYIVF